MKTINLIAIILIIVIVLVALLIILFEYFNEKLENINYKLHNSEIEYFDKMKEKYNIIIKFIQSIENKYKIESKTFDEVRNIVIEEDASFKSDKLLIKCYKELVNIKEDNQKNKELKVFKMSSKISLRSILCRSIISFM